MGRELKRVPLDFKWPIDQIWKGYFNPYHSQQCKSCEGRGYNKETLKIYNDWYAFDNWMPGADGHNINSWQYHLTEIEIEALAKEGRLDDFIGRIHFDSELSKWVTWGKEAGVVEPPVLPTPDEVNAWAKCGMGHDGINCMICAEARARHLGVYGICEICNGEGELWVSEEIKKLNEEWVSSGPPTGDGYQLWTTTNEGAPISPVFKSLQELCEYAEANCTVFGHNKTSAVDWYNMLTDGFVAHRVGNFIFL